MPSKVLFQRSEPKRSCAFKSPRRARTTRTLHADRHSRQAGRAGATTHGRRSRCCGGHGTSGASSSGAGRIRLVGRGTWRGRQGRTRSLHGSDGRSSPSIRNLCSMQICPHSGCSSLQRSEFHPCHREFGVTLPELALQAEHVAASVRGKGRRLTSRLHMRSGQRRREGDLVYRCEPSRRADLLVPHRDRRAVEGADAGKGHTLTLCLTRGSLF